MEGRPGLTDNQFKGKKEFLPFDLPEGSTYTCTDTFEIFVYDVNRRANIAVAKSGSNSNLRKLTAYNGVIDGVKDILTINADTTKFDIKAFKYRMLDKTDPKSIIETIIDFPGATGIPGTTLAIKQTVYIYIDENQTITQDLEVQGGVKIYDKIILGNLDPDNATETFNSIASSPQAGYGIESTVEALLRRLGGVNLEGCIFSGNSDMTMQKTEGTAIGMGRGYDDDFNIPDIQKTLASAVVGSEVGFLVLGYIDGSGDIQTDLIVSNEIDATQYNNNGVLTSVTNSQFTILRLFYFFGSEVPFIYYGNAVYNSLANAELGVGTELFLEDPITYEATSRGFLIVKGDVTDLTVSASAKFILPNRIRL